MRILWMRMSFGVAWRFGSQAKPLTFLKMTTHFEYFNNLKYSFLIDPPTGINWGDREDFPPLSPRKAIDASKVVINKLFPHCEGTFKFAECSLRTTPSDHDFTTDFWYYHISWEIFSIDGSSGSTFFSIPVYLDGNAVWPGNS